MNKTTENKIDIVLKKIEKIDNLFLSSRNEDELIRLAKDKSRLFAQYEILVELAVDERQ